MEEEISAKAKSRISKFKAQQYGQQILKLMEKMGKNSIIPEEIVKDAKNPKTIYHEYFIWDNKIAGHKYRIKQAEHLLTNIIVIKTIRIGYEEKTVTVRMFHNIKTDAKNKGVYMSQDIVFAVPELREQIIAKALAEAKAWYERYYIYQELSGISTAIETVLKEKKEAMVVTA